jgi:hypothetical protein
LGLFVKVGFIKLFGEFGKNFGPSALMQRFRLGLFQNKFFDKKKQKVYWPYTGQPFSKRTQHQGSSTIHLQQTHKQSSANTKPQSPSLGLIT